MKLLWKWLLRLSRDKTRPFWDFIIHYYLQILNNSEKFSNLVDIILSIYMVYQWPHENILKKSVWPREKIEVKGGCLVKKWEFGQTKKNIYQLFKRRSFAFMTCGRFLPKNGSELRFVIRDSRVREPRLRPLEGLEPLNLGWQISNLSYFCGENWPYIIKAIFFSKSL